MFLYMLGRFAPNLRVIAAVLIVLSPVHAFSSALDDVDLEVEEVMADSDAMKVEAAEAEKRYQEELKERKTAERMAKQKKAEALGEQKKSQKLIHKMEKQIAAEKKLRKVHLNKTTKAEMQIEKFKADTAEMKAKLEESDEQTKMTRKQLENTEEEVLALLKAKKVIRADLNVAKIEKEGQVMALEKLRKKEKAHQASLAKLKNKSKRELALLEKQKQRNQKFIENSEIKTKKYMAEIRRLEVEMESIKELSQELKKEAVSKKGAQSKAYHKYKSLRVKALRTRKKYGAKKVLITKACNGRSLASIKGQKIKVHKKGEKVIVLKYNKDWYVTPSAAGNMSYISTSCLI